MCCWKSVSPSPSFRETFHFRIRVFGGESSSINWIIYFRFPFSPSGNNFPLRFRKSPTWLPSFPMQKWLHVVESVTSIAWQGGHCFRNLCSNPICFALMWLLPANSGHWKHVLGAKTLLVLLSLRDLAWNERRLLTPVLMYFAICATLWGSQVWFCVSFIALAFACIISV